MQTGEVGRIAVECCDRKMLVKLKGGIQNSRGSIAVLGRNIMVHHGQPRKETGCKCYECVESRRRIQSETNLSQRQ